MPSAGDSLSLGALGKAVGVNGNTTTQTALAANGRGSTGTQTSLSDFYISAVGSFSGVDTTPDESTNDAVTITFSDEGSLFASRIKDIVANFTWIEVAGGTNFNIGGTKDYSATIQYGAVSSNTAATFGVKFKDFFNDHATNYDTTVSQAVTIQNLAPPTSWTTTVADFGLSVLGHGSTTSVLKTLNLSNGSGDTVVNCPTGTFGTLVASISKTGDPGTSGNNNSATGYSAAPNINCNGFSGTIYIRFGMTGVDIKGNGGSSVRAVTITNNSVTDNVSVTVTTQAQ